MYLSELGNSARTLSHRTFSCFNFMSTARKSNLLITTTGLHICNYVIVSGRIKGAARVTNVMYPCGFICIPVVLTLRRMNLIKN